MAGLVMGSARVRPCSWAERGARRPKALRWRRRRRRWWCATATPSRARKSRRETSRAQLLGPPRWGPPARRCSAGVMQRRHCPSNPRQRKWSPGRPRCLYNSWGDHARAQACPRGSLAGRSTRGAAPSRPWPLRCSSSTSSSPHWSSRSPARGLTYFTFNPWLPSLPGYLRAGPGALGERLDRAFNLALFWFSADGGIFGVDWGLAVTAADLVRFTVTAILAGAYFASWRDRRDRLWGVGGADQGAREVLGRGRSVLGLASGGRTVMGCGAPDARWWAWPSSVSHEHHAGPGSPMPRPSPPMGGMTLGILYLAWRAGPTAP